MGLAVAALIGAALVSLVVVGLRLPRPKRQPPAKEVAQQEVVQSAVTRPEEKTSLPPSPSESSSPPSAPESSPLQQPSSSAPEQPLGSKKPVTLDQLVLWRENVVKALDAARQTNNQIITEQVRNQANKELAEFIGSPVSGVAEIHYIERQEKDKVRISWRHGRSVEREVTKNLVGRDQPFGECDFCFLGPLTPEIAEPKGSTVDHRFRQVGGLP
jgi:hypothetical protein